MESYRGLSAARAGVCRLYHVALAHALDYLDHELLQQTTRGWVAVYAEICGLIALPVPT